ncbi:hypothetical protein HOLleu_03660 [Holothuria leucospilota]|uniref:NACHT domain-containing protein n=1 Tax=Holothuria leucospilota TaxID=206669 RepID=A0A9Q1CTA5_HOLLE|nr:hypothetical protein HOLleu_03660 [Holothuria leucospilota]
MSVAFISIVLTLSNGLCSYGRPTANLSTCISPQYLELGKAGNINCLFHESNYAILWYNTKDYLRNAPIIHYQGSVKSGFGYESGEYDVHENGSLIINKVSAKHELTFYVVHVHSVEERPTVTSVHIIVMQKPVVPYPVFGNCGNNRYHCYLKSVTPPLQCSLRGVRPKVTLQLVARTKAGDRAMSSEMSLISEGDTFFMSVATTDPFYFSSLLALLVCKATSPPGMLQNEESVVLINNDNRIISPENSTLTLIERNAKMELSCADDQVGFLVWEKVSEPRVENHEVILYSIFIGDRMTETIDDDFFLESYTSLIVPSSGVKHEGLYMCSFGDGLRNSVEIYNVVIRVHPTPLHPLIEGCNRQQYCALETNLQGSLTCNVYKIRPQVQLQWKTYYDSDSSLISFTNQHSTVKQNGETFDISLTTTFHVLQDSIKRVSIECTVPDEEMFDIDVMARVDLMMRKATVDPTELSDILEKPDQLMSVPVITVVISVTLVCGIAVLCCSEKLHKIIPMQSSKRNRESTNEMDLQMLAMKKEFVKQIRTTYSDWYSAVQPIPYIKDRLYCIDKVFVDNGMELVDSKGVGQFSQWKKLESYHDLFSFPCVHPSRRILEGDPGYGKTTVTLRCAYDWCNSVKASALMNKEILIVLLLRQIKGVPSIYRAIKDFILPKDTKFSEQDIENILGSCTSASFILDGLDEYPDQDVRPLTDVMNIIAGKMFQEFEVLITMRSSCLPKKCPSSTKRFRLSGFDHTARRNYIRSTIVGDNEESVRHVETYLREYPLLSCFSHVPLLFVLFSHMVHGNETFRNINSVTKLFRYMITAFHSHMKNKMEDENVCQYDLFENDHRDLDRVAFHGLHGGSQGTVWPKKDLCEQIGQTFYDQYVRTGILIETEVMHITDDPGTKITEHVQYKTEVRFYHEVFCEWFAAHYIADYLQQNPNVDLTEFLQHLDPVDVQYMYRFACGLSFDFAEKIIKYLKNSEGGDTFAILCTIEQTEKVDQIKESIRQVCFEGVIISGHDSLSLQRSSLELLKIAARNKIPIEYVRLHNCPNLNVSQISEVAIKVNSNVFLSSRIPIKKLMVTLTNREITDDEAHSVLKFCSMCSSLLHLVYTGCVLPRSFNDECSLATLRSRGCTVKWRLFSDSPVYELNLQVGRWMDQEGYEPATEVFEEMRLKKSSYMTITREGDYKDEVELSRANLKRVAEQRLLKNERE